MGDETPTRQVVYTTGGGRLGNQLLNYINLGAFAIEHREFDILNLAFFEYRDEYGTDDLDMASFDSVGDGAFLTLGRLLWHQALEDIVHRFPLEYLRVETIHWLAHHSPKSQSIIGGNPYTNFRLSGERFDSFDLADPTNVARLRSRPLSVLAGWGVRAWPLVEAHRDTLQQRVQPAERYREPARTHLADIRDEHDTVIGVLVRQGDYRTWQDGRYFRSSEAYREWLDAFAETLPASDVGFLIASDESQPGDVFDDDAYHFATGEAVGPNHYIENFVGLSLCDQVVTPPSTFSTVAAFLNDVPVVPLYEGVDPTDPERLDRPLLDSLDHPEMNRSVQ